MLLELQPEPQRWPGQGGSLAQEAWSGQQLQRLEQEQLEQGQARGASEQLAARHGDGRADEPGKPQAGEPEEQPGDVFGSRGAEPESRAEPPGVWPEPGVAQLSEDAQE
jgi:hypothetical protein